MIVSKYYFFLNQEKPVQQQKKIICRSDTSSKGTSAAVAKVCEPCQIKKE
jgi:hypothetical protein